VVDVVIADVSGKGVAAALLMPSLAVALRLRAREQSGPAEIIKDLDDVLKQITNPATFVTMFYARFNQATRTLQYASGGHNPPILIHPKTGESQLLKEAGPSLRFPTQSSRIQKSLCNRTTSLPSTPTA
jgi:sigma-B regulation protein RsbU (phosphoserine phosphatase)